MTNSWEQVEFSLGQLYAQSLLTSWNEKHDPRFWSRCLISLPLISPPLRVYDEKLIDSLTVSFLKKKKNLLDEKLTQRWLKQSHRQHKENSEYFSTFLRWTSINLSSIHLLYKRFLALITISRNPSKFHDIITVYLTRELNSFEFEWYDLSIDVIRQSYRWRHNCHRLISTAIRNSKKKKKTALQISFLFVIE